MYTCLAAFFLMCSVWTQLLEINPLHFLFSWKLYRGWMRQAWARLLKFELMFAKTYCLSLLKIILLVFGKKRINYKKVESTNKCLNTLKKNHLNIGFLPFDRGYMIFIWFTTFTGYTHDIFQIIFNLFLVKSTKNLLKNTNFAENLI